MSGAEDARHELPPVNHFGARKTRRSPHIYSAAEIDRLIEAALRLRPKGGLRSRTYATLIALLSVTGLRISEALKLAVADVTRDGLLIRETKFRKTRLVPLHDTAGAGLKVRRRPCSKTDPVFVHAWSAAALHCGQRDLRQAGRQGRYRTGGETPPACARSAAHVGRRGDPAFQPAGAPPRAGKGRAVPKTTASPGSACHVGRPGQAPGGGRPQRCVLWRARDRPFALRDRHVVAHGAACGQGSTQRRRRFVHESIIGTLKAK